MTHEQVTYYIKMMHRDRLIPIYVAGKFTGVITYFIGSSKDVDKYVRNDAWSIIEDEPIIGDTCYIDQLITNKLSGNQKHSRFVFNSLVNYVKTKYPQVEIIRWNRYKEGKIYIFQKNLNHGGVKCML